MLPLQYPQNEFGMCLLCQMFRERGVVIYVHIRTNSGIIPFFLALPPLGHVTPAQSSKLPLKDILVQFYSPKRRAVLGGIVSKTPPESG